MTEHPVVKRDLVEQILELRGEVERKLMRNKYYLALGKLDELIEALRPLEAEVIEEGPRPQPTALAAAQGDRPTLGVHQPAPEPRAEEAHGEQPHASPYRWEEPTPANDGGQEPHVHEARHYPPAHDEDADLLADGESAHRPATAEANP